MGFYRDRVLPRVTNVLLSDGEHGKVRERVASGLSGVVLEVGFGSGLNVPYYPSGVERVLAVDPATVGRKLWGSPCAERLQPPWHAGRVRSPSDGAIKKLTDQVRMTVVPGIFLDHVDVDPSQRARHPAP